MSSWKLDVDEKNPEQTTVAHNGALVGRVESVTYGVEHRDYDNSGGGKTRVPVRVLRLEIINPVMDKEGS